MADYVDLNRAHWDERAPAHAASKGYGFAEFLADPEHLSGVVQFDRPRLGDLHGVRGVHLQCHIGTDTLSLARLGARMTGLDFSAVSLEQARSLAERAGAEIDFHQGEVYHAVDTLGASRFDLVYTGVGALCWLPDIARWARVVAGLLAPGGRLFIRESHPLLWALDETADVPTLRYPYFERPEPMVFDEEGTYVESNAEFTHTVTHEWNHGIGEIITAVLDAGLQLTQFVEHDSAPWLALPGQMTRTDEGEWRLADRPERLAATYTLQAVKG